MILLNVLTHSLSIGLIRPGTLYYFVFREWRQLPADHQRAIANFMNNHGFTLLELVIVIVIIGIIATAGVFSGFDTTQTQFSLKAEAQKLASNIRYIQSQALTQNQSLRVNINSDNYTLTDLSGNAENRAALRGDNTVEFADISITTDLPNDCVAFDSEGKAYTSCTDTSTALTSERDITLTKNSQTRSVIIAPHSGTVWLS